MTDYLIHNGELYHVGVKGMKWGVRKKSIVSNKSRGRQTTWGARVKTNREKRWIDDHGFNPNRPNGTKPAAYKNSDQYKNKVANAKKAVKIGSVVAGTVLIACGAKKLNDAARDFNYEQGRRAIERIQRSHDLSYQRYWLSQNR